MVSIRIPRFLRLGLTTVALFALMAPAIASADDDQAIMAAVPSGARLSVDSPTPNSMVSNGQTVDIGGWTTGSRVDIYLDGPAGAGRGVGSTAVSGPRSDTARITGTAANGFDVTWQPTDLNAGPHTLWIYSLADGAWTIQQVSFMAQGNVLPDTRIADGGMDDANPGAGPSDSVTE